MRTKCPAILWGNDTLSRETILSNLFCSNLKRVYPERKELTPLGIEFFPSRLDSFQKGIMCKKTKWKSQMLSPLEKLMKIYQVHLVPFNQEINSNQAWPSFFLQVSKTNTYKFIIPQEFQKDFKKSYCFFMWKRPKSSSFLENNNTNC